MKRKTKLILSVVATIAFIICVASVMRPTTTSIEEQKDEIISKVEDLIPEVRAIKQGRNNSGGAVDACNRDHHRGLTIVSMGLRQISVPTDYVSACYEYVSDDGPLMNEAGSSFLELQAVWPSMEPAPSHTKNKGKIVSISIKEGKVSFQTQKRIIGERIERKFKSHEVALGDQYDSSPPAYDKETGLLKKNVKQIRYYISQGTDGRYSAFITCTRRCKVESSGISDELRVSLTISESQLSNLGKINESVREFINRINTK